MEDRRIKILHLIGNASLGGVAACLLNYFRFTDKSNFRFDFVTYGKSGFDARVEEIDPTSRIYTIPSFEKNPLGARRALYKACLSDNYAVFHSHMTTLSALALPCATKAEIPVRICHAHSAFDKNSDKYIVKKLLRPWAASKATHYMACSEHAARNLFRKKADQAFILPNAIDLHHFSCNEQDRLDLRKKFSLTDKTVLFTGRFVYQKNLFFLLEAFSKACEKEPMTLVLVGDGKDKPALQTAAKDLGIASKIRFIAPCDPADWYKAADVFCLPSRYEGLGMVAVEAQAAGLPCILSYDVPDEADVSGKSVFLPTSDPSLWAEKIVAVKKRNTADFSSPEFSAFDIRKQAHLLGDFYAHALKRNLNEGIF